MKDEDGSIHRASTRTTGYETSVTTIVPVSSMRVENILMKNAFKGRVNATIFSKFEFAAMKEKPRGATLLLLLESSSSSSQSQVSRHCWLATQEADDLSRRRKGSQTPFNYQRDDIARFYEVFTI